MITAGDRFADVDNVLTILRAASVIGVVSVGMTFVIIGGGIDLSVGALVALASIWATTLSTQAMAADVHWTVMVVTALLVGAGAGLVNGVVIAYGKLVAFIATLAMLAAARGLAEIIANRRTQIVQDRDFLAFFSGDVLGVPTLVIIFALVAVAGWVLLNRTTFGRRTFAVGGNAEAARRMVSTLSTSAKRSPAVARPTTTSTTSATTRPRLRPTGPDMKPAPPVPRCPAGGPAGWVPPTPVVAVVLALMPRPLRAVVRRLRTPPRGPLLP